MENQLIKTLKSNKLLKNIDTENLAFDNIRGALITLNEGEILFREGDASDTIYLVLSGEVNLIREQEEGKAYSTIFSTKDFFGQEEFLEGNIRHSTAIALRDSYVISLAKAEIDNLIEQNDEILRNIYAAVPDDTSEEDDEIPVDEEIGEEFVSPLAAIEDESIKDLLKEEEPQEESHSVDMDGELPSSTIENLVPEEDEVFDPSFMSELEEENTTEDEIDMDGLSLDSLKEYEASMQSEPIDLPEETEDELHSEEAKEEIAHNTTPDNLDEINVPEEPSEEILEDISADELEKELILEEEEAIQEAEEEIRTIETVNEGLTYEQLDRINKAAQLVNSNIKIDDVLQNIVDVALDLTNADRGTLYLVEKEKHEIWSKVFIGDEFKEIKLKFGEGLAGWVAQSGEIINLEEVDKDERFNRSFDKSSGYQTKSMLCFPIKDKNEEAVGVLQLLNSKNGKFSKLDEEFLDALSIHAALALQNAELLEKFLKSERISSLGKMANFLIQDIKKPILVSKRYAEHLKTKGLPESAEKVLEMLLDQLNNIADLVQSTSSYSEGQSVLRSVTTNLSELLDDYLGRVESFIRSRNCIVQNEFDSEIKVKVDIKEFFQCFNHIIKNACDAMPDGGNIVLTTKLVEDKVKIYFRDFGLGIPETLQDRIFEPFMSHGKKEGTGLGLSVTKKIVEEHGGTIEVQSDLGEGATFIITLPVAFSV